MPSLSQPTGLPGVRALRSIGHALIVPWPHEESSVSSCATLGSRRTLCGCFSCVRLTMFCSHFHFVLQSWGVKIFFLSFQGKAQILNLCSQVSKLYSQKNEDLKKNPTFLVHRTCNWNHRAAVYINFCEALQLLLDLRWGVKHSILIRDTQRQLSLLALDNSSLFSSLQNLYSGDSVILDFIYPLKCIFYGINSMSPCLYILGLCFDSQNIFYFKQVPLL